jgi:undecaprenyl pyrophosphate synthase
VSQLPPPEHVAIIMDGNSRWARERLLPRVMGHKAGIETIRRVGSARRPGPDPVRLLDGELVAAPR